MSEEHNGASILSVSHILAERRPLPDPIREHVTRSLCPLQFQQIVTEYTRDAWHTRVQSSDARKDPVQWQMMSNWLYSSRVCRSGINGASVIPMSQST